MLEIAEALYKSLHVKCSVCLHLFSELCCVSRGMQIVRQCVSCIGTNFVPAAELYVNADLLLCVSLVPRKSPSLAIYLY